MRALVVANRLPWPIDDGWKVRTAHVVRGIAAVAETTLLTLHRGDAADAAACAAWLGHGARVRVVPAPAAYRPWQVLLGALSDRPVQAWNQWSPALHAAIGEEVARARPDVTVAVQVIMAPALERHAPGIPMVIDTHNIDSLLMARYAAALRSPAHRLYATRTASRFAALERGTFGRAAAVWTCSDVELPRVRATAPGARAVALPNGVDTTRFTPRPDVAAVPGRLFFFGRLDYVPNDDAVRYAVEELLPRLRAARPDAELVIAGPGGARLEEAFGARAGVRFCGAVDDLGRWLAEAAVVLVPLRSGGGTRLKILEALAAGRPVVSTSIGAEGITLPGPACLVLADGTEALVRETLALLAAPERGAALGARGREAVVQQYDWTRIERAVGDALRDAASVRGGDRHE